MGVDEERQAEGPDPGELPASGGRNAEVDFHGQQRSNATHASTTDRRAAPLSSAGKLGACACSPMIAAHDVRIDEAIRGDPNIPVSEGF